MQSVWVSGVIIYLLFILSGMEFLSLKKSSNTLPNEKNSYSGIVYSMPEKNERSVSVDCILFGFGNQNDLYTLKEKIRLYLPLNSYEDQLQIGDSIFFTTSLQTIRNPGNPGEFDYAGYMQNQGIFYSGFVWDSAIKTGGRSACYTIRGLAAKVQKHIIRKMSEYNITDEGLAVLSALVAGNRQLLGGELKENYTAAGAMHILAVSGLHVGILYLFLSLLLFRNNNRLFFRLLRLIIILLAIWGYAFITGLSSSVLRASVMFSMFLIGKSFNRMVNSYNILAASALIILVCNPMQLFRVGFQFSYLAVLGIIYFQPRIENLLMIKNPVLDRIWQLITISIAAQITTFPLTLYYFNQFPVYFWLSNIVVIPAVWLIMLLSLLFFIFSAISPIASLLALCLKGLLFLLNNIVELISHLPGAVIENIRFPQLHLIGFLLVIILIIMTNSFNNIRRVFCLILSLILLLLMVDIIEFQRKENQSELIIYNLRNHIAISLIDGHKHVLVKVSANDKWKEETTYLKKYWINREVLITMHEFCLHQHAERVVMRNDGDPIIEMLSEGTFFSLQDRSILLLLKPSFNDMKDKAVIPSTDILLINADSGFPAAYRYHSDFVKKLIVLGRISGQMNNAWKHFAESHHIEFYSIRDSGAFHEIF